MNGQLTIWDAINDGRPCRYGFKRYLGQRVNIMLGGYPGLIREGTVVSIEPYYTEVLVGGHVYAGTPYNLTEA